METQVTHLYRSIHAQPEAVRGLLNDWDGPSEAAEQLNRAGRIFLSGIGTSYHAAWIGEYLLRLAGVDAWAVRSFEFIHYPRPLRDDDGVIIISHRGNKSFGNAAVKQAVEAGVITVGITGQNSPMSGVNTRIETVAQDPSSTHTISYCGSLVRLAQIAVRLAAIRGQGEVADKLEQELQQLPALMESILQRENAVRQIAQETVAANRRLFFVGAGPNAPTASEAALKAKEAAYVTAEGFELEQFIHGPQVGVEADDLVIPIVVKGAAESRLTDLLKLLNGIHTNTWVVGQVPESTTSLFEQEGWSHFSTHEHTPTLEVLTPLLTMLPVQLLADFLASERGTNADSFRSDQETYKQANALIRL